MSPRPADPAVRVALIEAAARLLHEQGRAALTARRVAAAVGTSTMAVYTHFGGMEELLRAVRAEGFARLAAALTAVPATRNPVADVVRIGGAYVANAVANPDLYRVMFGERPLDDVDRAGGESTLAPVIAAARRCVEAGRFAPADPVEVATQLWTLSHGVVDLHLSGLFPLEEALARFAAMGRAFLVGLGADRRGVDRALRALG